MIRLARLCAARRKGGRSKVKVKCHGDKIKGQVVPLADIRKTGGARSRQVTN